MIVKGLTAERLFDKVASPLGNRRHGSPLVWLAAALRLRRKGRREDWVTERLGLAIDALRRLLVGLDATAIGGAECLQLVGRLATLEKTVAAARITLAARVESCGSHHRAGFTDAADWLARTSGTSVRRARAALDTAALLPDLPLVNEALRAGKLSVDQAAEIARTVDTVDRPHRAATEADLLDAARHHTLRGLQERARRTRLGAIDPDALHRRQHEARYVRHWVDGLGMVRLDAALPPEIGLPLVTRLDAATDRLRRQARRPQGRAPDGADAGERRVAYAADALITMVGDPAPPAGGRRPPSTKADLVLVCDLRAYRRGHAHAGEVSHVVGGGPLPVAVLRELARDAFLKAVLHDGVIVHTVKHMGRHIPAELRTALEVGAPPEFDGVCCVEAGCDRRYGLEWDHVRPVAAGGETSFANLDPRCWPHHRAKSERERAAGVYRAPPAVSRGAVDQVGSA